MRGQPLCSNALRATFGLSRLTDQVQFCQKIGVRKNGYCARNFHLGCTSPSLFPLIRNRSSAQSMPMAISSGAGVPANRTRHHNSQEKHPAFGLYGQRLCITSEVTGTVTG